MSNDAPKILVSTARKPPWTIRAQSLSLRDSFKPKVQEFVVFRIHDLELGSTQTTQAGFTVKLSDAMSSSAVKHGELVVLQELDHSLPLFKEGASLRVTGKLQEYSVETATAVIVDGSTSLKIDTQHLRDLNFRKGSIYQFIGELHIRAENDARVGRNVDGIDLNLYHQSLQLRRQFQADYMKDMNNLI
ncbi:hypothetical protein ACLOJK_026305 [Asimina triloba]